VTSTQASSLYLGSYQVLADRDGPGVAPSKGNLNLKLNFKLDLQVTTSMKGTRARGRAGLTPEGELGRVPSRVA
jgi:hypothetical protein